MRPAQEQGLCPPLVRPTIPPHGSGEWTLPGGLWPMPVLPMVVGHGLGPEWGLPLSSAASTWQSHLRLEGARLLAGATSRPVGACCPCPLWSPVLGFP